LEAYTTLIGGVDLPAVITYPTRGLWQNAFFPRIEHVSAGFA